MTGKDVLAAWWELCARHLPLDSSLDHVYCSPEALGLIARVSDTIPDTLTADAALTGLELRLVRKTRRWARVTPLQDEAGVA